MLRRAVEILRVLQGEGEGLSLSQIAARVSLPRSTVHRIVSALAQEGFVAPASPTGRVRLGPALASLGLAADRDLLLDVHPFLARLSREANETVDLAVLEYDHVLFVDHIGAPRRLRAVSAVGSTFPAHCTANGKALLAALPDDQIERLLPAELPAFTPGTLTDRASLLAELGRVRADGVAFDREEHTVGICAVGALVHGPGGRRAAVTIPLPAQRFYGSEERLAGLLRRTCAEIDATLAPKGG